MGCSLPGSSVPRIFQARVLEWGTIAFSSYCLLTHKGLMTLMTWYHKYSEPVMFCGIARCFRPPWIYDDRMKENEQSPVRVWKENCGWIQLFIPCEYERFWVLLSAGYGKESIYQIKSCPSFICNYTNPLWRRQWQPTPVFLPGKSHGRRSLVGCSPWGH